MNKKKQLFISNRVFAPFVEVKPSSHPIFDVYRWIYFSSLLHSFIKNTPNELSNNYEYCFRSKFGN